VAERWEPSSKTGSGCGWVDEHLTLAERPVHCRNPQGVCGLGLVRDRALNAAIKLSKLAGSSSASQNVS
jgi:hypothetical protein